MESTYQRGVIKMHLWSYPRTQRIIVKQRGKGKWRIESLNNIRTITGAISWVMLNRNGAHKIEKPRSVVLKNGGTFGKNLNGALKLLKDLIKWKFEIYSAELNLETSRTIKGRRERIYLFLHMDPNLWKNMKWLLEVLTKFLGILSIRQALVNFRKHRNRQGLENPRVPSQ